MGKKTKELTTAEVNNRGKIDKLRVNSNGRDLISPATGDRKISMAHDQGSITYQYPLTITNSRPYH